MGEDSCFSEGMTELDWCKRLFYATDTAKAISWEEFVKKGYYVVPAPPEKLRSPCAYRWFAEGRPRDLPEAGPLPYPAAPCRMSQTPVDPKRAPLLGEHNEEIFVKELGISSDELHALKESEII